jgi:hypothetical protein
MNYLKSTITTMNRIKLWWKFDGSQYGKRFKQGVKNLWQWFPVIWKDRDWDSYYIYEILRFKLEKQAFYIKTNDRHIGAALDAKRMLLCARLIEIQKESMYESEHLDYYKVHYDFVKTTQSDGLDYYTAEPIVLQDNLDDYFARYPRQYERVKSGKINRFRVPSEEKDRYEIAMEIALDNQDRSRKLLFKILEQHLEEWWD